jgi:hypothetical protein
MKRNNIHLVINNIIYLMIKINKCLSGIGGMKHLRELNLSHNNLVGPISDEGDICDMDSLEKLYINDNPELEFSQLTHYDGGVPRGFRGKFFFPNMPINIREFHFENTKLWYGVTEDDEPTGILSFNEEKLQEVLPTWEKLKTTEDPRGRVVKANARFMTEVTIDSGETFREFLKRLFETSESKVESPKAAAASAASADELIFEPKLDDDNGHGVGKKKEKVT